MDEGCKRTKTADSAGAIELLAPLVGSGTLSDDFEPGQRSRGPLQGLSGHLSRARFCMGVAQLALGRDAEAGKTFETLLAPAAGRTGEATLDTRRWRYQAEEGLAYVYLRQGRSLEALRVLEVHEADSSWASVATTADISGFYSASRLAYADRLVAAAVDGAGRSSETSGFLLRRYQRQPSEARAEAYLAALDPKADRALVLEFLKQQYDGDPTDQRAAAYLAALDPKKDSRRIVELAKDRYDRAPTEAHALSYVAAMEAAKDSAGLSAFRRSGVRKAAASYYADPTGARVAGYVAALEAAQERAEVAKVRRFQAEVMRRLERWQYVNAPIADSASQADYCKRLVNVLDKGLSATERLSLEGYEPYFRAEIAKAKACQSQAVMAAAQERAARVAAEQQPMAGQSSSDDDALEFFNKMLDMGDRVRALKPK